MQWVTINGWEKWKKYFVEDEIEKKKKGVDSPMEDWKRREVMIWFIAWIIFHKRDGFAIIFNFQYLLV